MGPSLRRWLGNALVVALLVPLLSPIPAGSAAADTSSRDGTGVVPLYPELSQDGPRLSARAAVLMDAETGAILYAQRAGEVREPASTTKVMTALLALEFGDLDDIVVVSRRAARTPGSSAGLRAGEQFYLGDLIYGLMLPSGNDAAVAIAEHISGSVPRFVALMNERAQRLGMQHTHFENPHGLPNRRHVTTALDLARLTRRAILQPGFLEVSCARWHKACDLSANRRLQWQNTNRLLWSFPYTEGGKTGTTSAAGRCLIAVARQGRQRLIAVVLNAPDRWADAQRLLQWGFDTFALRRVARAGDRVGHLAVLNGTAATVPVFITQDLVGVVPKAHVDAVRLQLWLPRHVPAPVLAQQPVGQAVLSVGRRVIATAELRAAREVGTMTPMRRVLSWVLKAWQWLQPADVAS